MLCSSLRLAALTGLAAGAAVPRDHNGGPVAYPPSGTRAFNLNGIDVTCTRSELDGYMLTGIRPFGTTCDVDHYANTRNGVHFHELNFERDSAIGGTFVAPAQMPGQRGAELIFNNLGGAGPHNGCSRPLVGPGQRGAVSWPSKDTNNLATTGNPNANFAAFNPSVYNSYADPSNPSVNGYENSCCNAPDACYNCNLQLASTRLNSGDPVCPTTDPPRIELNRITTIKCNGPLAPDLTTPTVTMAGVAVPLGIPASACAGPDLPAVFTDDAYLRLRIYATGPYRPADFGVDENKFQEQATVPATPNTNTYNRNTGCTGRPLGRAGMFQINLRPVYNEFARSVVLSNSQAPTVGQTSTYTVSEQPFMSDTVALILSNAASYGLFTAILPDLGSNIFDARYTNTVPLTFVFTTQSGAPYRMDEFYISFFDFDQDYADSTYAFVRETLFMFDFHTMFVDQSSEIERRFSNDIELFRTLGGYPTRTLEESSTLCQRGGYFENGPGGDWRACATPVNAHGVVLRSSREGTGLPQVTKYVKERCAGFCSRGQGPNGKGPVTGGSLFGATCTANQGTDVALGSALNLFASQCSDGPYPTTCSAVLNGGTSGQSPLFTWTGCGFSDSNFLGVVATGTGPDNVAGGAHEPYLAGTSIACELDCPRVFSFASNVGDAPTDFTQPSNDNCGSIDHPFSTSQSCDDAGNPTDILCLTNQQRRRAVTFLFRSQWRITLQFRTEVGGNAIVNPTNDLFNTHAEAGEDLSGVAVFPNTRSVEYGRYSPDFLGVTNLNRLTPLTPRPVKFDPTANFELPFCPSISAPSTGSCISLNSVIEDRSRYNPDLARLSLGSPQDPKGRNFLFGGSSALMAPPPPTPPCLLCRCDDTCADANNGLCDDGRVGSFTSRCPAPTFANDPIYQSGVGTTDCTDCGPALDCAPVPPECFPPPPPPPIVIPPMGSCSACLDPHLTFAHGGRADFKGKDQMWYPMLSARNVTMNTFFVHDDFQNPNKIVHGSAMKSAAWVLRTNVTGTVITVEYNASSTGRAAAYVKTSDSSVGVWVSHEQKPFVLENIAIQMRERKLSGVGKKSFHGVALVVETGLWQMSVWSKPYPNAAANPGKALLNIHVEALYDADLDPVAPHGLIGQSYDGDAAPVDGELDDYKGKEVTTKAMAEGALEGAASDYELRHKFATRFRYSRFDATAAKHRDTSKLAVKKDAKPRKEAFAGTATADLDDEAA